MFYNLFRKYVQYYGGSKLKNKFEGYVIYTDMDGTLLNDDKEVSRENIEAINYFISNGGKFSIATGRAIQAIEKYFEYFKINLPAIVYNGGMIATSSEVIFENTLDNIQKKLVDRIKVDYKDIGIEIYCGTDIYVFKNNGRSERPATKLLNLQYNIPSNIFELSWNKVLLVGGKELVNSIANEFEDKYDEPIVKSGEFYLEILPKDASKGSGLEKIIQMYNLDRNKVIAVGDNMNDYEMLEAAGISFCPKNAEERIKDSVDYIINDNNHHVIAQILKELKV